MKKRKKKSPDHTYKVLTLIVGVLLLAGVVFSVVQTTSLKNSLVGYGTSGEYCYDSDAGINLEIKGICTDHTGKDWIDFCFKDQTSGKMKLREYYCDFYTENCVFETYDCEDEGYGGQCSSGSCPY